MNIKLIYYYFSFVLGLGLACVVDVLAGKKRGMSKKDTLTYTVTGFTGAVLGAMLMAKIYNTVLHTLSPTAVFADSKVSLYGGLLFMPLFMLLPVLYKKQSPSSVYSVCAPGVFCLLGCAKTGCFVYGCCYGIPCTCGFFNEFAGQTVFPVQLLEGAGNFLIAAVLFFAFSSKKENKTAYPIGLILYGIFRFAVQFLRNHDAADTKLLLFADFWQLVSVVAVLTGIIWLILLKANQEKRSG